jgi:PI-3-kinase-related kinase SMG-1
MLRYTFLLKGQEDLRLDERIMQLLRICNALFAQHKNVTQKDAKLPYTCTPYSVTPLGFRSGLIEWVNEATPLFQVYRKWRIRQVNQFEDYLIFTYYFYSTGKQ